MEHIDELKMKFDELSAIDQWVFAIKNKENINLIYGGFIFKKDLDYNTFDFKAPMDHTINNGIIELLTAIGFNTDQIKIYHDNRQTHGNYTHRGL